MPGEVSTPLGPNAEIVILEEAGVLYAILYDEKVAVIGKALASSFTPVGGKVDTALFKWLVKSAATFHKIHVKDETE